MSSKMNIQRICQYCENEFIAKTTVTNYCSSSCGKKSYKARKQEEKIMQSNASMAKKKNEPMEKVQAKEFLTVKEAAQLLNCSIRSIYYSIEEGSLSAVNLGQRLTRIKRSEIDRIFKPKIKQEKSTDQNVITYSVKDCYTLTEAQVKYGVSAQALDAIIKRNNIPKQKQGCFVYVPKQFIDNLFKL